MKTYYCWRCGSDMPFLNEQEWQLVSPLLGNAKREIVDYRRSYDCDLTTARKMVKPEATRVFESITGMADVHFDTIHHHRIRDSGPECEQCGHLLRTPRASFCAQCGKTPDPMSPLPMPGDR